MRVILGVDFLKAYDAEISLKKDTVSTMINTLMEEKGCDRVPVRVGQDCAMHLNWCYARVE